MGNRSSSGFRDRGYRPREPRQANPRHHQTIYASVEHCGMGGAFWRLEN